MSKEKTPIQGLIEGLERFKKMNFAISGTIHGLSIAIDLCKESIEEEREQIEEAYDMGHNDAAEGYYHTKYYTDKYGE